MAYETDDHNAAMGELKEAIRQINEKLDRLLPKEYPPGTRMLFLEESVPGWTKDKEGWFVKDNPDRTAWEYTEEELTGGME